MRKLIKSIGYKLCLISDNRLVYSRFSEKIKMNLKNINDQKYEEQFYDELKSKYKKVLKKDEDFQREVHLLESSMSANKNKIGDPTIAIYAILFSFTGVFLTINKDVYKEINILVEGYEVFVISFGLVFIAISVLLMSRHKQHNRRCRKDYYLNLSLKIVNDLKNNNSNQHNNNADAKEENKYIKLFNEFQNDEYKKKEYHEFKTLYKCIRDYYIENISKKEIDGKIERAVLEKKLGRYNGQSYQLNSSLMIGLVCSLLPLYLQSFVQFSDKYKALLMLSSVVIAFITIVKSIGKDLTHDRDKDTVFDLSVKILDEIEKEGDKNCEILREVAAESNQENILNVKSKDVQKSKDLGVNKE